MNKELIQHIASDNYYKGRSGPGWDAARNNHPSPYAVACAIQQEKLPDSPDWDGKDAPTSAEHIKVRVFSFSTDRGSCHVRRWLGCWAARVGAIDKLCSKSSVPSFNVLRGVLV